MVQYCTNSGRFVLPLQFDGSALCPQLLQKWHLSTSFISVRVSHSYTVCSLFSTQFTLTLHGSQPKIILHGEEHFWRRSFMWSRDFPFVMQPEVSLPCSQQPAILSCPVEFQSRPQPYNTTTSSAAAASITTTTYKNKIVFGSV